MKAIIRQTTKIQWGEFPRGIKEAGRATDGQRTDIRRRVDNGQWTSG